LGALSTSPKRSSTLSIIKPRRSELLMPPVVAFAGMASKQKTVRLHDSVDPFDVHCGTTLFAMLTPEQRMDTPVAVLVDQIRVE
jgi:hypothetical protein